MDEILKQTKVNFQHKKPHDLAKRLPRMYDIAKLHNNNRQEKEAFIMFKRWINIIEWITKNKDFKDSPYYASYITQAQVAEVKTILEKLETILTLRYAPKKRNAEKNNSSDTTTIGSAPNKVQPVEGSLNLPETPTDEPLSSETDGFLSCLRLFQLMQSDCSRLLIIDVRSDDDYFASKIKVERCINIPGDKIKPGVIASSFEKLLSGDRDSWYLFSRRSTAFVDRVVLLDWRSTHSTLFPSNKMRVLKDILQRWDPDTRNKCPKIEILDGGYAEWLNSYPAYVTNSNVKAPDIASEAMDEILEGVEYPDWLNSDDSTSPFNSLSIRPTNNKNSNVAINPMKSTLEITKPTRKLDNRNFDNSTTDEDELFSVTQKQPNKSSLHNVVAKPTVDRSSKPPSLINRYADCTKMLILMRQNYELVKAENVFENKILKIEMTWHCQDVNDNADMRLTKGQLEAIKSQLEEVTTKRSEVKAALQMEKVDETAMSPKDLKEKNTLDLKIGTEEQRRMKISIERKKLHESIREQEQKRNQLESRLIENGIHKEPLKLDGPSTNSGLKRSHSSPNLAQLDDRKVPHVDRTSKPPVPVPQVSNRSRQNTKISQYRLKDREDRMEPVYRNGHPGITGLKNLGNSCYMNSIIQCLSNTAYLARYFNDNMHIDHLNTSNENSTQSLVADEVAHVIKALWRGQYKSISPRDLKVVIGQYKLQFDTCEQQDSHEFLTFLLDWMHNDLKREVKIRMDGPLSPADKEWDKAMESRRSIISDLFFGQLRSSIVCATCGNSSITYETFNSLTMSLPHTNRCTLDDCVKKYVSGQKVCGWKCPNCKVPREAMKKFDFMKLAPVVVIHLNRFAETDGWLEKKNTCVDFPLTDFNLKPYLVPDHESSNTIKQFNHNYSLYAVSNHYGTMDGGHYTAYCKSATQNKWYKYDDQTVSEVDRSTVKSQTASAYLLFYTSISSDQFAYR